jgi:hypothetical protein
MQGKHIGRGVVRSCLVGLVLGALGAARADGGVQNPEMQQQWIRWGNGLRTEYLVFNALSTNPTANVALTQNPLSTSSFSSVSALSMALYDPGARYFMKYLVSCALAPEQEVSWTPSYTGGPTQTWKGGGALCSQWSTGLPDAACLERVSACILARNNPSGIRVRVSLRGGGAQAPASLQPRAAASPDMFTSAELVPPFVQPSMPILSFSPCPAVSGNDCGWLPLITGSCTAGTTVQVKAQGSSAVCGALRVCRGTRGCDQGSTDILGESPASCGSSLVSFTCPQTGRFSAISQLTSSPSNGTWGSAIVQGGSSQLLSEPALFPIREGAFYGNLFGSSAVMQGLSVRFDTASRETRMQMPGVANLYVRTDDGWCQRAPNQSSGPCLPALPVVGEGQSVYSRMYSCSAPEWAGDPRRLPGRVCALPGNNANCASHLVGLCQRDASGGDCGATTTGDFLTCKGHESARWMYPITTFMPDSQ